MSSTGPGSLLVFLAFLMLSMLLAGTYFTAYLGLVQAGREVQKAGEAASEQAIVYLFQHPTNIMVANGSVTVKGETRIVVQNVGSRDISFDRILAISPDGSVVADVKVPGNKGLGVRQWQLYKVQDLGLPERWSNFTVFSSEVSRLVLLSERGRTHGSIWGVPPFLEGVLRATVTTTMTTSYFYSYITTTSYRTTHTITIRLKQDMYSLTEEWWESGRKVELDNVARRNRGCSYYHHPCCENGQYYCEVLRNAPTRLAYPNIKYFPYNASVTLSYPSTYTHEIRKKWCDWVQIDPNTYACMEFYEEHYYRYKLQAIELVDWDTGKVYLSINQTSVTFNIDRDTRAKAMYVLESSWSRSWSVIVYISGPTPESCMKILNDPSKVGTREWCECARKFDPDAWKKVCTPEACLKVNVGYCCLELPTTETCLSSWSGRGGKQCVKLKEGERANVTVYWSASWTTKPGWSYYDTTFSGPGVCYGRSSGHCEATLSAYQDVTMWVTVVFKKTQ
jgi:hypothetical protein